MNDSIRGVIDMDLRHFWRPATQMKDYEEMDPILVDHARGMRLYLRDGRVLLDGISSWWCKSLGHAHPEVQAAFIDQVKKFEHVIMANCCAEPVAEMCFELSRMLPPLDRVFIAENGSVSVEVALKMSVQYHAQSGHPKRNLFAGLQNGYHGETILTTAVGDCDIYSKPFSHLVPVLPKIAPIPYVSSPDDPRWNEMDNDSWEIIRDKLDPLADRLSAIVLEPVIQGAGGMKVYSPDLLRKLRLWTRENGVHLIADEIFTGFGRTGEMFACDSAGIVPDFMTLSKGLCSGFAPMAVVLTSSEVFRAFYADYNSGKTFMHSTTYSGYAPAAAAALAVMKILKRDRIPEDVKRRAPGLRERMRKIGERTGALNNLRGVGFAAAADIVNPESGKPFRKELRVGYEFFRCAVEHGALLRPIGDSFYMLPPLNTSEEDLDELASIAEKALLDTLRKFSDEH